MPKKKKSSGFAHQKSGKRGGSGFKGRRKWSDVEQGKEVSIHESTSSNVTEIQSVSELGSFTTISGPDDNILPSTSQSPTFLTTEPNSNKTPKSVEETRFNVIVSDTLTQEPGSDNNISTSESSSVIISSPLTTATDPDVNFPVPSSPSFTSLTTVSGINTVQGEIAEAASMDTGCSSALASNILCKLNALLPLYWKCILGREGFHVVLVSKGTKNISIQREVYASFIGNIEVFVHKKGISDDLYKGCSKDVKKLVSIKESAADFCDNVLKVVLAIRQLEICAGSDHKVTFEQMWTGDTSGVIDYNPYDESRYEKTFRSNQCTLLVPVRTWRCPECAKCNKRLRDRLKHHQEKKVKQNTKNEDPKQVQVNHKSSQKEMASESMREAVSHGESEKINYLITQVSEALNQEGVYIDKKYAEDLTNILQDWGNLTPIQKIFLQQQKKLASCKGTRWHPTMIRLALSILSTSSTALPDLGIIRLPCQKVLFDYSHAVPITEGIFPEKLQVVGEEVKKYKEEHHKYFSLLLDEFSISQNLVYRKSDGALVGYVKLEDVAIEMQNLQNSVNSQNAKFQPASATGTKILAYLIKGCTNNIKNVVAVFPTSNLTKEHLYSRTWDVIRECEDKGIQILALVCEGSSIYRAFIAMHAPATPSEVVFDTVHLYAPDRKIFFIVDSPYLLKNIRDCFAKSGTSERCTRLMKIGEEFIQWKTIERLYLEGADNVLRRSYKLHSQNVYLNSHTCRKVSYAAQVMSRTVAMDLKDRNWPDTGATVNFILMVNNFFDCLNGSYFDSARKKANDRLKPYRVSDDERFNELKDFEKYIRDWEKDVRNLSDVSESRKAKMTLNSQAIEGISITVNGFIESVQFLLSVGAKYVHGRSFSQDSPESYFRNQRTSLGGRNSPTNDSCISSDSKISAQSDYNVKKRYGDTTSTPAASAMLESDSESLPKRRKIVIERRKSF